jgi:hypothetical protein
MIDAKRYRLLLTGETIQAGDEFFHTPTHDWKQTSKVGQKIHSGSYEYRRAVEIPSVDPGAGYRLLELGEIIKPDDQRFINNEWIMSARCEYYKRVVALDYRYRREIKPVITKVECVKSLKPRHVARAERLFEVRTAIKRYVEHKKDIPHEWLAEYLELAHDDFMMTL